MKIQHPNKLLETPVGLLYFNLLEQSAYVLTDELEAHLKPPPKGLYLKGQIVPLLTEGHAYFTKQQQKPVEDIQQVFTLKDDILDAEGRLVISQYNLTFRRHLFTFEPTLPISAIQLCYHVLMDHVFHTCKYARGLKRGRLEEYVVESYIERLYDLDFEEYLSDAFDELHDFITESRWNIYMHRLQGTTLMIEKYCDWRIYEWTRMRYEQQQEREGDFY